MGKYLSRSVDEPDHYTDRRGSSVPKHVLVNDVRTELSEAVGFIRKGYKMLIMIEDGHKLVHWQEWVDIESLDKSNKAFNCIQESDSTRLVVCIQLMSPGGDIVKSRMFYHIV
jgi:hypothetical protein